MNPNNPNIERQAVVIIHGIGEQEPMATLREFAASIIPEIENDPLGLKKKFYAKPDELSQLFDLRRITVPQDEKKTRQKTDFYEYYWAHQIRDTKASDVIGWSIGIFKHWKFVPKRLKLLHSSILLLLLLIPLLAVALFIFFPSILQKWQQNWVAFMAAGAGSVYILLKLAAMRPVTLRPNQAISSTGSRYARMALNCCASCMAKSRMGLKIHQNTAELL
jgi:hypothetical protein